jgi:quercetin dioxygenase-like cupin family protein
MDKFNLNDFIKGWFVGDFDPSIAKTQNVEVGIKRYKKGENEERHHHRVATEITVIISGEVEMNGTRYKENDIISIPPNISTDFKTLADTVTCVVKLPGATDDKFLGDVHD